MSIKKLARKLKKALPGIAASAPAVIAAVIEVKRAFDKSPKAEPEAPSGG
jgi:hypothetical protein